MLVSKAVTLVSSSDDDFQYNPEYKVLICKKCKHTVKGLETHLEDAYRLKKKERRPLLNRYSIPTYYSRNFFAWDLGRSQNYRGGGPISEVPKNSVKMGLGRSTLNKLAKNNL